MKKQKIVRGKTSAEIIWKRKLYYNLSHFSVADICKIFETLHPNSDLFSRKNHYKAFLARFRDISVRHKLISFEPMALSSYG